MNRNQRRAMTGPAIREAGGLRAIMSYLVTRMAADGPKITDAIREAVGGRDPRPAEVVDVLVNKSVEMEGALLRGDFEAAMAAAAAVLFLARDVAVRDGRIEVGAEPAATKH